MSWSWAIQGTVRERPRKPDRGIFDEYDGEDVYHPNAPDQGQINEMLINLMHSKRVILIGVNPGDFDTNEEIAEEFKNAAADALRKWRPVNWNKKTKEEKKKEKETKKKKKKKKKKDSK